MKKSFSFRYFGEVPLIEDSSIKSEGSSYANLALGWLMDDWQKVYDVYEPYMHERFDTPAAQAVTKRLLDIFHMAGTEDQIGEKIEKIGETGIKTEATTLYTIVDKKGMIQEIGNKIIPNFRK